MRLHPSPRRLGALAAVVASALALAACSAGDLGSSEGKGGAQTTTLLVNNTEAAIKQAEGLVAAFKAKNPDITVKVETRPGGSEGDNIVKTRLSTGDMTDVFEYNTGSLFQAIGAKLEAAKKFLEFMASPEGCDAQAKAAAPTGPFAVTTCKLPADVPQSVKDMQPYFDNKATSPALEFLSPIKGPALEQITVEVGSGIREAADGAALYDKDVEKQAKQLGIEGW